MNHDGWTDIVIIGFPGEEAWWFENPHGKSEAWDRHVMLPNVDDESPTFTDITGDGVPELVCATGGQFGYAEIPKDDPTKEWKFHAITPKRGYQRFTHGLGVGDVNGDGRQDLLEKDGWWEHPAPGSKAEFWKFHPVKFSEGGGSQMYAFDVNGDGRNDVVTSKAAHAYGLSWFENVAGPNGEITFKEHQIMGEKPEQNEYGVAFSQLHAMAIADMDHDGVPDIITGKRYWAHAEHDPGVARTGRAVLVPDCPRSGGEVHFIPHQIDTNSGVGTQVVVGDINGDTLARYRRRQQEGHVRFYPSGEGGRQADVGGGAADAHQAAACASRRRSANQPSELGRADGIPATAADGRVLNLDFEKGDLSDWTATGDAFEDQPIEGDTVHTRRGDSVSGHKGHVLGWHVRACRRQTAGHAHFRSICRDAPYASFLVGGGAGACATRRDCAGRHR